MNWFKKQAIRKEFTDTNAAYFYAKYVVKGPFPKGELAISRRGCRLFI